MKIDSDYTRSYVFHESTQKRVVLVVVSVALLLDNMLYMVVVPILPAYMRHLGNWNHPNRSCNQAEPEVFLLAQKCDFENGVGDKQMGFLFASKAVVQLITNPLSGHINDRIAYEYPLIGGLLLMFVSTITFAFANSYWLLFLARSIQGLGTSFAATSGLALIADRFKDEKERSAAIGIALACISFGSLIAPPFGGVLYQFAGKSVPFLILAVLALIDAFVVIFLIKPNVHHSDSHKRLVGTPMWRLFIDPYIAVCSGTLIMANMSLSFLEPTLGKWMMTTFHSSAWQQGIVWLPPFFPSVFGVFVAVKLTNRFPSHAWILPMMGLVLQGFFCLSLPFMTHSFWLVDIPMSGAAVSFALVDTAILPMLAHLVDTRHVSVYGNIYAIADISYCLAYALGPIVATSIVSKVGFMWLNIVICISNLLFAPLLICLRNMKRYESIGNEISEMQWQ